MIYINIQFFSAYYSTYLCLLFGPTC